MHQDILSAEELDMSQGKGLMAKESTSHDESELPGEPNVELASGETARGQYLSAAADFKLLFRGVQRDENRVTEQPAASNEPFRVTTGDGV